MQIRTNMIAETSKKIGHLINVPKTKILRLNANSKEICQLEKTFEFQQHLHKDQVKTVQVKCSLCFAVWG